MMTIQWMMIVCDDDVFDFFDVADVVHPNDVKMNSNSNSMLRSKKIENPMMMKIVSVNDSDYYYGVYVDDDGDGDEFYDAADDDDACETFSSFSSFCALAWKNSKLSIAHH